ncbi:MAG TPA: hypothetical protein VF148_18370 [Acidimicrobiia bacterium]
MRRLLAVVALLVVVPGTASFAAELDELLERGQEASYSAEQIISCSTPDGIRDALVRIEQVGGELQLTSSVSDDVEVTAGAGGWTITSDDGLLAQATVNDGEPAGDELYMVEEEGAVEFLGRVAMAYLLVRDGEPRAELTIDDETGVVVKAVTLTIDNDVYCERRFVSLDTEPPVIDKRSVDNEDDPPTLVETSSLPERVSGFELLDQYEDDGGVRFAYYSDGFFSFALFETPTAVAVPEATPVELGSGDYLRVFTAGQVTYVWETRDSGMVLVGDLPPDLHEAVLAEMPRPEDPGLFRRWWRALFG